MPGKMLPPEPNPVDSETPSAKKPKKDIITYEHHQKDRCNLCKTKGAAAGGKSTSNKDVKVTSPSLFFVAIGFRMTGLEHFLPILNLPI